MMDMEEQDMDETIEMYIRLDEGDQNKKDGYPDEAAAARTISSAMALLAQQPCIRCQSARFQFESATTLLPTVTTIQQAASTSSSSPSPSRALCSHCGFCLEQDALLYVGGAAQSHRYVLTAIINDTFF